MSNIGQSQTSPAPFPRRPFLQHHFRLCWKILLHCDLKALLYRKMFCCKLMIPVRWTHFKGACLLSHSPDFLLLQTFKFDWTGSCSVLTCWHLSFYLNIRRKLFFTWYQRPRRLLFHWFSIVRHIFALLGWSLKPAAVMYIPHSVIVS